MVRFIVSAVVVIAAVTICAGFVLLALSAACAFTSDPLDVWEDA